MRLNFFLPVFFLACLMLFFGCTSDSTAEFNRANCNKLSSLYGSFEGTICAKELTQNFTVELSQLRQAGHEDMADNIYAAAAKDSIVSYSCNPNDLGAGVVFEEAGVCSENQKCVQLQDNASCKTIVAPSATIPSFEEILDLWDKRQEQGLSVGFPAETIDSFCDNLYSEHNNGNKDIEYGSDRLEQGNGAFEYAYWVGASYCDTRKAKENVHAKIVCKQLIGGPWKSRERSFEWQISVSYSSCGAQICSTVSEFNAECSSLESCQTISGEKGITGPGAVPLVSFDYSFSSPDLDSNKIFLDGEQFLIKLYQKLGQLEAIAKSTGYSEEQFNKDTEFTVRLRAERYTNQILQDFAGLRSTQFFSTPEPFNKKWYKFFEVPIITLGFSKISAGEYKAEMVFDWAGEPYQFFANSGEPAVKTVTIRLQKISNPAEEEKSPFLEFSLDYDLTAQDQGKAKDYGVQFAGSSEAKAENLFLYQTLWQTAATESLAGKAYKKVLFTVQNDFAALNTADQKGNVLAMSNKGGEMTASFSRAIPVGTLIDVFAAFSNYRLKTVSGENAVEKNVPSFNEWVFSAENNPCYESITELPIAIQDNLVSGCLPSQDLGDAYQIKFDSDSSGKVFGQTVFFTPTTSKEPIILLSSCGTEAPFATIEASTVTNGGTISLSTPTSGPAVQSIEGLFEQIKNKNICVSRNNNETIFGWNKKAIELQYKTIRNSLEPIICSSLPENTFETFQQNFNCDIGDKSTKYLLFELASPAFKNDKVKVNLSSSLGDGVLAVFDSENNLIGGGSTATINPLELIIRNQTTLKIGVAPLSEDKWEDAKKGCSLEIKKQPGYEFAVNPQRVLLHFDGAENIVVHGISFSFGPIAAEELDSSFAGRTDELKSIITETFKSYYAPYNVEVSTSDEPLPAEPYSTVYFASLARPGAVGLADSIDSYNSNVSDGAIVFVNTFSGYAGYLGFSLEKTAQVIGNAASHEFGHLLGLSHVVDPDDVMYYAQTLKPQVFKTSRLHKSVFPIGNQNGPQLLTWSVGKK